MRKKKLNKYILDTFQFDVEAEKAAYDYLCQYDLKGRQKKLIDNKVRFENFQSWESYIIGKYKTYSKESLVEFSRYLNLLLRESNRFNDYTQNICIAYLSASISSLIGFGLKDGKIVTYLAVVAVLPFIIAFLIMQIYDAYGEEGKNYYFLYDVKEIIDKIIADK